MQAPEEMHQPEPVPEAFVPNNNNNDEPMQTSQTSPDHAVTKTEQAQEDAVMAEAEAPPPPSLPPTTPSTNAADIAPSTSVTATQQPENLAQASETPGQISTSSTDANQTTSNANLNLQAAQQQSPATMPPRTLTPVNNANGGVDDAPTIPAKAAIHGAPARAYLNTKVTGVLLEGMKLLAKDQPEDPLRVLGEYLLKRSKDIESKGIEATS